MLLRFLFLAFAALAAAPVQAGVPEARETARLNNCAPKKIEVYQNQLGREGKVIYQVTCTLPKTSEKDSQPGPDALLIMCDQSLCELMRPVATTAK